MEEQAEFKRLSNEIRRDTVRGVSSAIRFFHNRTLEKERRLEKAEQKSDRAENQAFREKLRTPGEKDYDFMLESGRDISYHTLDPNTDLEQLKSYLDSEKLQYCIRHSSLDNAQEMVFFTKDRAKVQRALEKSITDLLNKEENTPKEKFQKDWQKAQQRATSPDHKLGWTPHDDVNHSEFYRDDSRIYQSYEATGNIEMDEYGLPAEVVGEAVVETMALNDEVSIEKLKDFMAEYDLPVAFKTQPDGTTEMYFLFRTDQLSKQKAALKSAFLELEKNPDRVRKIRPTMKEAMRKAKTQEKQLFLEATKKTATQAKDLGQDFGRGLSR